MKLIDENGRLFGKLNVFDLVVAVIVIVGIVAMATRLITPADQKGTWDTAVYTVEFVGVEECYTEAFRPGDTLYENKKEMGTITQVEVSLTRTPHAVSDGTVKMVERAMAYNVLITVETDRFNKAEGAHVGAQELLAGTSHKFSNGYATATGVVREIK